MKLSDWAKKNNIRYRTAHRWFQTGQLPVEAVQTPSGSIFVKDNSGSLGSGLGFKDESKKCVLYARVSSHDQKSDMERQMSRLEDFAAFHGYTIASKVEEIGSGLNGTRAKLMKILGDNSISTIIVEHRDRLTRFGFEYIAMALEASGRNILVINESEEDLDIVQDFVDVVTSMCARIYGKRGAKNRADRAVRAAEQAEQAEQDD